MCKTFQNVVVYKTNCDESSQLQHALSKNVHFLEDQILIDLNTHLILIDLIRSDQIRYSSDSDLSVSDCPTLPDIAGFVVNSEDRVETVQE